MPASSPRIKAKAKSVGSGDNTVVYEVGIALLSILLGFILSWTYMHRSKIVETSVAFAKFGPVVVKNKGYIIAANFALQTSASDARWTRQNNSALQEVLQTALANSDPETLRAAAGMTALQTSLKSAANAAFPPARVQNVWLTDLTMQPDDN